MQELGCGRALKARTKYTARSEEAYSKGTLPAAAVGGRRGLGMNVLSRFISEKQRRMDCMTNHGDTP